MPFELLGKMTEIETIAINRAIREVGRLPRQYGRGRWRERKGIATVLLPNGMTRTAEVHWYEATGTGRKEYKIKRFVD